MIVGPPRLTIALASCVAMISRRRRWLAMASGKRSRSSQREIALELAPEIGIVGDAGYRAARRRARAWHRRAARRARAASAPRCAACARSAPCRRAGTRRERSSRPCALERLHQPLGEAEVAGAAPLGERERQRLQVVVAQDEAPRPRRSSRRAARCGRPRRGARRAPAVRERDLDVDLDVGGVDAGRVVDGVGVEADAARAPPRCGRAASRRGWRPRRSPWRGPRAPVMRMASLARSPTSSSVSVAART